MQKLYCYVDESGQDTKGRLFVVSVVVVEGGEGKNNLFQTLELCEKETRKGKGKWSKSKSSVRLAYLERVLRDPRFAGNLRYSVFSNNTNYDLATITAIAKALYWGKQKEFKALVYVDGLSKTKRVEYAQELRKLRVPIEKIRGVAKDENDALIRLADTLAGFVRDALEEKVPDGKELFEWAKSKGIIVEV